MDNVQFRQLNCDCEDEMDQVKFILNSFWPKSDRIDWLKQSNKKYPLSFILFNCVSESVIGHARLCALADRNDALYAESVIISTNQRGKGYGKTLMKFVEEECTKRGCKELYLATTDQQDFYGHLGYEFCSKPVMVMHCSQDSNVARLMKQMFIHKQDSNDSSRVFEKPQTSKKLAQIEMAPQNSDSLEDSRSNLAPAVNGPKPPPPPPPPPAAPALSNSSISKETQNCAKFLTKKGEAVFMSKKLP